MGTPPPPGGGAPPQPAASATTTRTACSAGSDLFFGSLPTAPVGREPKNASLRPVRRSYRPGQPVLRVFDGEVEGPAEAGAEAVRAVKAWIDRSRTMVSFPVEVRFVAGEDNPLSPASGRDTCYNAGHL